MLRNLPVDYEEDPDKELVYALPPNMGKLEHPAWKSYWPWVRVGDALWGGLL
jgi:hypothetical protein